MKFRRTRRKHHVHVARIREMRNKYRNWIWISKQEEIFGTRNCEFIHSFYNLSCDRSVVLANRRMRSSASSVNIHYLFWCDFDRASSLICGNKMPTRCNRGFYCRSYCLLNMLRAQLCPSSGAQDYYTCGCCLWYFLLWLSSCWSDVELRVMCPVCRMLQHPANRTHDYKVRIYWKRQRT